MPTAELLASYAPSKELPGTKRCLFPLLGEGSEGLSLLRGGKLTSKGISPSREKEVYERRLRTYPEGQVL
jgi:hypothetical protein